MPPNAAAVDYDGVVVECMDDDNESDVLSDSDEEDTPLPPPVTEDTPFEFDRICDRMRRTLDLDHDMGQMDAWEDDSGMVCYIVEIRSNISGMRKIISSSGDITYRRRDHIFDEGHCRIVDMFWDGTDGVCESCRTPAG